MVGTITPASFKSLMVVLISAIPPGMWYWFWFTIFLKLSIGSSSGFYLAFPTIIALTPPVREPMWRFCQLISMSIPIMHSEAREITTGWVQRPTGLTVRWTGAKTLLTTWLPLACTLAGEPQWCFGSPGISVSSEPVSSNPWKVWLFPFLNV